MHKSKYLLQAFTRSLFGLLLVLSLVLVFHQQKPVFGINENKGGGNSGAIWTTNIDCGETKQDENHYSVGDTVFLHGEGFDENSVYSWKIEGQPGGASGDPNSIVASGQITIGAEGKFCIIAYVVQTDDWGEYDASVQNKKDNYRVGCNRNCPTPTTCLTTSPTATTIPTVTPTLVPPTPTTGENPTPTTVPPTPTTAEEPTPTPTEEEPTSTPTLGPTSTPVPGATNTPTPGPTNTPQPGPTNTPGPGPTNTPAPQSGSGGSSNPVVLGITTAAESTTRSNANPLITGIQKSRGKILAAKTKKLPKTGDSNVQTFEKTPSGNQLLVGQYLSIPRLGMVQSLYQPTVINGEFLVGDKEVLVTNNVFYGHNDLAVFGRLSELQIGDEILVIVGSQQKAFHVGEVKIIKDTEVSVLQNSPGIVLLTCLDGSPELRLMVLAR